MRALVVWRVCCRPRLPGGGELWAFLDGRHCVGRRAGAADSLARGRVACDGALMGGAEAVEDVAVRAVAAHLGIQEKPQFCDVHYMPQAIPQYAVGHHAKLDRLTRLAAQVDRRLTLTGARQAPLSPRKHSPTTPLPSLLTGTLRTRPLAGSSMYGVAINDIVANARQTALTATFR